MEHITLKDVAIPIIEAIDQFNFLLKSHHRRVAIMSYFIGKEYGLKDEELANLVVAAAMHDIGALSVEERDTLIQEDVEDPEPHCIMAYRILKDCELFKEIGMILKHHHVSYEKLPVIEDDVRIQSHIIHLADRIDIYLDPNRKIYEQIDEVSEKIRRRTGRIFHPDIFDAYLNVSNKDEFWIGLETISMEEILSKIDFSWGIELNEKTIINFAIVISKIVDYRSHFTATHSFSVGNLAYMIGKILKYPDDFCLKLQVAGLFHDIGKIGINPSLIEKRGVLKEDEFEEIKKHSDFTGKILNELTKFEWFKDIVKWAVHHHERIDGSGYPSGLSKDEMDEGMIIVAYADVVSAMMEDRPQRKALSTQEMLEELKTKDAEKINPKLFKKIKKNLSAISQNVFVSQLEAHKLYIEPLENLLKSV